jgi:hypothetical protein
MFTAVEDRIVEVRNILQTQLQDIHKIQAHPDNLRIMQAVLYSSFIDALGATRYGRETITRERFTRVIVEHSNWLDADKICPMHLHRFLEKSQCLPHLKSYMDELINDWRDNQDGIIYLELTPTKTEIAKSWPNNGTEKLHGKTLDHFTHANLLYGMRNGLLHQNYAAKGVSVLPKEQENVYYIFFNKYDDGGQLELIHPPGFLANLCKTLLLNVMNYLEDKNQIPWGAGHFPDFLIDKL